MDEPTTTKPDPYEQCEHPKDWSAPVVPDPKECAHTCKCPSGPVGGGTDRCLQDAIDTEQKKVAAAKQASSFVEVLTGLQKKVDDALSKYTRDIYKGLRDDWIEFDGNLLLRVIQQLECPVKCWPCVVECRLCHLLNKIRNSQLKLDGTVKTLPTEVHSMQELLCWNQRSVDLRQKEFDRIDALLTAWVSNPAEVLRKALTDNAELAQKILDSIATDQVGAMWNLFMRVLPLHFAIAPSDVTSKVPDSFKDVCKKCDPDDESVCCTVHTGERSLRQQLIGPKPYIVDPDGYPKIICCLVQHRYQPASASLAQAQADLDNITKGIDRIKKEIADSTASLQTDFIGDLKTPIDCADYKPGDGAGDSRRPAAAA